MIIDYSKPYTPSGMNSPMSGDFVHIRWEAPIRRPATVPTWELNRYAQLLTPISAPVLKFKGHSDLPAARVLFVRAWNGKMAPGVKSW